MEIELIGLTGVALCSAHLCLGLWGGYKLSQGKAVQPAHTIKPPFYLSDMLELIERSRRLQRTFIPYEHQLPAGLMPAVLQVFQAAETLHKRVSTGPLSRPPSSGTRETIVPVHHSNRSEPGTSSLSNSEFMSFALDAESTGIGGGAAFNGRRPYSATQHVAFFDEDLPAADAFEKVRCHDLSVDGVSFFLDRPSSYERLVISLGTAPELMFMIAKVVTERLVFRDGVEMYRVGCQFLKRVDPPQYAWNASSASIAAISPRRIRESVVCGSQSESC